MPEETPDEKQEDSAEKSHLAFSIRIIEVKGFCQWREEDRREKDRERKSRKGGAAKKVSKKIVVGKRDRQ